MQHLNFGLLVKALWKKSACECEMAYILRVTQGCVNILLLKCRYVLVCEMLLWLRIWGYSLLKCRFGKCSGRVGMYIVALAKVLGVFALEMLLWLKFWMCWHVKCCSGYGSGSCSLLKCRSGTCSGRIGM